MAKKASALLTILLAGMTKEMKLLNWATRGLYRLSCWHEADTYVVRALIAAGVCLCVAMASAGWASLQERKANSSFRVPAKLASSAAKIPFRSPPLPAFSPVGLPKILHDSAVGAGIELDEINFALEDFPDQPYLRYRATFSVVTQYRAARQFISRALAASPLVAMDSFQCARTDLKVTDLLCEFSFSAVYKKEST